MTNDQLIAENTRLLQEKLEMENDIRDVVGLCFACSQRMGIPISVFKGEQGLSGLVSILPGLIPKLMSPGGIDMEGIDLTTVSRVIEKYAPICGDLIPESDAQ